MSHETLRRISLAATAAAALALGSLVAVPALAADDDPSDGDVTLAGMVSHRESAEGPPSTVGIPDLDLIVYVDDGTSQHPIATLTTDEHGGSRSRSPSMAVSSTPSARTRRRTVTTTSGRRTRCAS
ncbi:MAG TPA: hypothetical protein VNQ48_04055 [Microbacteriaceae bacterium]|nr:hypothetical protein [Microbacteriaceae bacterium]